MWCKLSIDFNDVLNKLHNHEYSRIGAGSGRVVYDLDNGYVLKVSKNAKGIAQNKAEYKISNSGISDVFAKVIDVSDDYKFLVMEKASKAKNFNIRKHIITNSIFKELESTNLLPADLERNASWGIINKEPVIIDYGLTDEVYNEHYLKDKMLQLGIIVFLLLKN